MGGAETPCLEQGSDAWHMQRYNECWMTLPIGIRRQRYTQMDDNPVAAGIARLLAEHMTAKTTSERVAKLRADRDALGLKRLELYAHPDDWPAIKALAEKLQKRRARAAGKQKAP
jgi:hypothetical protein